MVHGNDGWEESEDAWELGEEEMMIVGTVQQEDDCSWQDASKSWMKQDEKEEIGIYKSERAKARAERLWEQGRRQRLQKTAGGPLGQATC